MGADRERRLLRTITELVGGVTSEPDLAERLQFLVDESADLFDVHAAGLMLFGPDGRLHIAASVGHHSGLLELLQLEVGDGPCLEAARTGDLVSIPELGAAGTRWPHFCRSAADAGYAAVHSIPLRVRATVIGSLNLFNESAGALDEEDLTAARALADIATISLVQQRTIDHAVTTQGQLQAALDSRTVIEQAKGWVANRNGVDLGTAFSLLRGHARRNQLPIAEVALAVLAGRVTIGRASSDDAAQR
ncbi:MULTISPECIES: ANTAR domain-containing protein [unclassified Curtobacterium]|uniref:ANTAR domain-containing protein n=1 Tax=unclassified Curtobacterium TaxID=257496 RepID=UPI00381EE4DF